MPASPRQLITALVYLLSGIVLVATRLPAGERGCARCGCNQDCQQVCRLVQEDKKVEVGCWGCKYEDFCLPGPSQPGCKHCDTVCADCPLQGADPTISSQAKEFSWKDWIPGYASVHTRVKLMK